MAYNVTITHSQQQTENNNRGNNLSLIFHSAGVI